MDSNYSSYLLNRELSWLQFNKRVLKESTDPNNPLLEKLKFLAITSSNLDEFFMIRVAGLKHQKESNFKKRDIANKTAEEQLCEISKECHKLVEQQYIYLKNIVKSLESEGIVFTEPDKLTNKQKQWLNKYFDREIFPVVTPLAVDSSHPFPFLASKSLNVAMLLEKNEQDLNCDEENNIDVKTAIVPVPAVLPRIIAIPSDFSDSGKHYFILLEDVICYFASRFFIGYDMLESGCFRITRDADLNIDEEDARDLVIEVERQLKKRQRGQAVRLEYQSGTSRFMRRFMSQETKLRDEDMYEINGPIDITMFFDFYNIKGYDKLRYTQAYPHTPWSILTVDSYDKKKYF